MHVSRDFLTCCEVLRPLLGAMFIMAIAVLTPPPAVAGRTVAAPGSGELFSELLERRGDAADDVLTADDEILITDEMIDAGEVALLGYDPRFGNLDAVARKVFEAMEKVRRRGGAGSLRSRQ